MVDFYRECRDSLEDRFCPLFEEDENKWFVEVLLNQMEFEQFCEMMTRKKNQEGLEYSDDDGKCDERYYK